MIATLLTPVLLQSAEPAATPEGPNDAQIRRITELSASLRAEAARCFRRLPARGCMLRRRLREGRSSRGG